MKPARTEVLSHVFLSPYFWSLYGSRMSGDVPICMAHMHDLVRFDLAEDREADIVIGVKNAILFPRSTHEHSERTERDDTVR